MEVSSVRPKVVELWFESRRRVWWEYVGVRVGLVRVIAAEDRGTAIPFLECSPRSSGACARWCCHLRLPYVFPPRPSHGAGEWGEGGVAAAIRSVASRVRPRFSSESMKFYLGKKNTLVRVSLGKTSTGRFQGGDPFRVGGKIYGRAQWACCSLLGSGPVEVLARPSSRLVPIREDLCPCLRPDARPFAGVGHPAL